MVLSIPSISASAFSSQALTNEGQLSRHKEELRPPTNMDSMRSLNTSLPSSTPRSQPPEQLLQSFKAAALSVTNLYKNAVCEQSQARQAGYQEAIEDLLQFLDRENLGLGDGEGWSVRQWATERLDGNGVPGSDDDDTEKRARSTTPAAVRKEQTGPDDSQSPPKPASSLYDAHVAPQQQQQQQQQQQPQPQPQQQPAPPSQPEANSFDRPAIFTFTSGPSFPQPQEQDVDMQPSENSPDGAPVLSVFPRNSRTQHRHNNLTRSNQRTSTREPSVGVGSKRKLAVPDFFDLSDMFGGSKRGRFT